MSGNIIPFANEIVAMIEQAQQNVFFVKWKCRRFEYKSVAPCSQRVIVKQLWTA